MSERLSEQLQDMIDTLTGVRLQAARAAQTNRQQANFSMYSYSTFSLSEVDGEVAQLISELPYTKALVEQREGAGDGGGEVSD